MLAFFLHLIFLERRRAFKFFLSLSCSFYFGCQLSHKNCPECYGNDLCEFVRNRQIRLTWFSCLLSIVHAKWTKSVFHADFNGNQVVVKRKKYREVNQHSDQNVILCPGVQNLEFLFNQIEDVHEKKLWRQISTSIEPLFLKYFSSQDGWPFPKYYGACGDLIMEEYKGEPLTAFLFSDFSQKTSIAVQLLKMAELFTFGHSEFAFYFTDYSLNNLVVDSTGQVSLIDLDSVVISNKSANKRVYFSKEAIHTSEIFDDLNYAFSPNDICNNYLSDHNFFSICKYLLSHPQDGLLNEIPEFGKHQELVLLLNECTQPTEDGNRIVAGQNLLEFLEKIKKEL